MSTITKILIAEHNLNDIELIERELKMGGIDFVSETAQNEHQYRNAIKNFIPDIILSDYSLPSFNGQAAFEIREDIAADTPFIFVSGSIGEENSIEYIKNGVTDYALKDKLFTLAVKVKRALKDAKARQEKIKIDLEFHKVLDDLQKITDSSLDVICAVNANGYFLKVSAASEAVWGYKPEELIGKSLLSFVYSDDRDKTRIAAANVMAGNNNYYFENRYIHKNGSLVPIEWSTRWDAKDQVRYGVARDATKKKRLEIAFENERKRFYDLFLQAPSCMGILNGPDHVFEMANPLYLQLIGKTDILGKAVSEVLPEIVEQGFIEILDDVYNTGKTFSANEMLIKLDKEGKEELVDVYLNFIYQAYRNNQGRTQGIFFFAIDVTEQVVSRKKIEESENRFRALIEKSAEMKTLTNKDGKVIYGSPSIFTTLGYSTEEYLLKYPWDIIHPEELQTYLDKRNEIVQTPGKSFHFQQRRRHRNGSWVWCEGTITNMLEEPGIHAMVSNFSDISEKKTGETEKEFDRNNLNALINNTADLMWSVDRNFNLITSNKPFDEMGKVNFGKTIIKGGSVLSVSDTPEMLNHFKQLYERAFAGEAFTEIEHFNYPVEFWTEISYYPIRKGNEVIGTACHSRDVTHIKKAEQQLRKSEAFNSGILNSLSSHIAVVDYAGNITAVNETWKKFALENNDTALLSTGVGNNYFKVCEKSANAGVIIAAEVLQGMKEVMDKKKKVFYSEYPCHSPTEQRWFGMRVIKFDSDEPMIVVAHQNITERKLAEEKLLQSESRLKEAQAIAQVGNWEIDMVHNTQAWSDELYKIYGAEKKEIPNVEMFLSFMHPDDLSFAVAQMQKSFATLENSSFNFRFVRRDGQVRYGFAESRFELDKDKKPIRLFGIVKDITQQKLVEEEREKIISDIIQRNKDLEQFSYIISHNLRAPVANIIGAVEILRHNDVDETDKAEFMNATLLSARKLDEVVADLNHILQVRKDVNEKYELFSFSQLTKNVKTSIESIIRDTNVQIITDFSAIDTINSLKSYMYSIFYNLISNSIKYKRSDVPLIIEIRSKIDKGNVMLSFKDNGSGIDLQRNKDNVFGLYKRFHSNVEGKGMGLFMVKTQVETLGGKISVNSALNKGTEFIMEFEKNFSVN